jgi:GT2 family glycosyltransferase
MTNSSIDLSIIIVTWNGKRFASQCLDSLRFYRNNQTVQVVVVDNASSDGTPGMVGQQFPWVNLIRNDSNLGFARANNIGIAASSGTYICLVNSDVVIPEGCLQRMQAYIVANPDVGMIGPQMLCPNGLIGRSYMRFPTVWRGFCNALGLHRVFRNSGSLSGIMMTDFDNSQTAAVDVLNGWFLMVRRRALEEVGMLDERFFMYGEDIDWSYRFHKAGWERVYLASARAFHHGGASSAIAPTRFYIELKRADLQLFRKHHGGCETVVYGVAIFVYESVRVVANVLLVVAVRSKRSNAALKMKRSLACIRWLCSFDLQTKVMKQ